MPLFFSFLLFLAVALPSIWIVVIIHEIGHAIAARMLGYRVTSLGLGTGRPFFRIVLPGGTIFFLCRDNATMGTCWTTSSEMMPSRLHSALLFTGGGILNIAVALLFYSLWFTPYGAVGLAMSIMNALIGIVNLFPTRHRVSGSKQTVASDGLQAISLFVSHRDRAELPGSQLGFFELWEAIGDAKTCRYRLTLAALAASNLEMDSVTHDFQTRAEALPADETDAHLLYLRGQLALIQKKSEHAQELLTVAREEYARRKAPGSVFWCDLLLLGTYPVTEAVKRWEELAKSRLGKIPCTVTALAYVRLRLFLKDPTTASDVTTMETLLARYESARRQYRSDLTEGTLYSAVASWRMNQGDAVGARMAWDRVQETVVEIERSLSSDTNLATEYRRLINGKAKRLGFNLPFVGEPLAL